MGGDICDYVRTWWGQSVVPQSPCGLLVTRASGNSIFFPLQLRCLHKPLLVPEWESGGWSSGGPLGMVESTSGQ